MIKPLPKHLRAFNYPRNGGVSRAAKGADCKSSYFTFCINGHSEKNRQILLNHINSLGGISECRRRALLAALYHLPPQPCAHSLAVRSGLLVNERGCVTSAALRDQAQLHDRCLYCLYLYYLRRLWP